MAIQLAEKFSGELICADSWTVYRGFDIGTAKPSKEDRTRVPHHLLDIADPIEGFNVVEFQRLARQTIKDISGRGKLPILVGGTGLYIDSIIYDYQFLPQTDPAFRVELTSLTLDELIAYARSKKLDLTGIDLGNKRRVVRLVENNGKRADKGDLRLKTQVIGIQSNRDQLLQRITERVEMMLRLGLESEVKELSRRYSWDVEAMKGIGYREWQLFFDGNQDLAKTEDRIIKASMDLAKRQRTWFKRNDDIIWSNDPCTSVDLVTTFLNKTD